MLSSPICSADGAGVGGSEVDWVFGPAIPAWPQSLFLRYCAALNFVINFFL